MHLIDNDVGRLDNRLHIIGPSFRISLIPIYHCTTPAVHSDSLRRYSGCLRKPLAVVLNLENVDKAMSRRVVDFLSGCVYALSGSVKKIAQSAYLFCPHNMDVVGDLESLQAEAESYI